MFDCHPLEFERILDFQVDYLQFKMFFFKYITTSWLHEFSSSRGIEIRLTRYCTYLIQVEKVKRKVKSD
uniref:Putative ovule protein n=1 Tax=Solanum chacoense TaxID=4108 RepID=A0A0V0HDC5_SOLCH